jgi:hypothetical protein
MELDKEQNMKEKPYASLNEPMLYSLLGLLSCLTIGYLFSGMQIFITTRPPFQFVVFGLSGAILFSVLKFSTFRNFLFSAAFLLLLVIIHGKVKSPMILGARILYFTGITIAIYVYHRFYDLPIHALRFGKFLSLAALVAVINLLYMSLGCVILNPPDSRELIIGQTFLGFLIGAGLGIGFEIAGMLGLKFPIRNA